MAPKKPYRDEKVLRELYHNQGLGIERIADHFGVSPSTIWSWLDRHDIEIQKWDPPEERFEQQYEVDEETGCWVWTGAQHSHGYGIIGIDGESVGAHRFSYQHHHGEIPDGAYICHKCHNPPCVNPDHLYAGDAKSNVQDAIENGDWPELYGEEQGHAVFTNDEVRELRERYANTDVTYSELTEEYGVGMSTLSAIINGEAYPNAGGPTDTDTHKRMAKYGEEANDAKLTESEVREIRETYADQDVTMADLAEEYPVTTSTISDIVNRKIWTQVE